jgi:hypothetical protein
MKTKVIVIVLLLVFCSLLQACTSPKMTADYSAEPSDTSNVVVDEPLASDPPDVMTFMGFENVLEIPAGETHYGSEAGQAGSIGYIFDSAGNIGPAGFIAISDNEFIILDQVNKQLVLLSREKPIKTIPLTSCHRPKSVAYFNGTIAVLDSEEIVVLNDNGDVALTAAIPAEHYNHSWNYGTSILFEYIDGSLIWQTITGEAYTLNGTELTAIPQFRAISKTGSSETIKQNDKTWTAEIGGSPIQVVDVRDDLLLTLALENGIPEASYRLGVYYSDNDISTEVEIDIGRQILPPAFSISPSGHIYMLSYYEDHVAINELIIE